MVGLRACTASWNSYLGWSRARPGQGVGSRPRTAAGRPGTSGSSLASGPSPLLCRPGTLADTWEEGVQDCQEATQESPSDPRGCRRLGHVLLWPLAEQPGVGGRGLACTPAEGLQRQWKGEWETQGSPGKPTVKGSSCAVPETPGWDGCADRALRKGPGYRSEGLESSYTPLSLLA